MKRFISGLVAALLFCVLVLFPTPASADEGCILQVQGTVGIVVCAGHAVGQLPLPTVKVQGPTVTLPPLPAVTEIVPGPVGPTKTVIAPGPTATVTIREPGTGETVYVIKRVEVAGPVVTKTPNATPRLPDTETKTVLVPQPPKTQQGVDQPKDDGVVFDPPPLSTPEAVGYSVLALLILSGLIVLALWLGYVMGYKDSEREERRFLEALRDQFYYKGKHS